MKKQIKYPIYFLLLLFIWSCKGDQPKVEMDSTLDISIRREPKMINPYLNPTSLAREVYQYMFLSMADFDPKTYKLRPILIKSIPEGEIIEEGPYKGGTKYTIEFKEEAKWDNGSPITAKDFLFSIKAIKHPDTNAPNYRSYIKWISDIEIDPENDKIATIYFKEYYILAKELVVTMQVYPQYVYDPTNAMDEISLTELSGPNAAELIESNPKLKDFASEFNSVKFTRETVSNAGPYRLKDWISNQTIILEKKET